MFFYWNPSIIYSILHPKLNDGQNKAVWLGWLYRFFYNFLTTISICFGLWGGRALRAVHDANLNAYWLKGHKLFHFY